MFLISTHVTLTGSLFARVSTERTCNANYNYIGFLIHESIKMGITVGKINAVGVHMPVLYRCPLRLISC